MKRDSIGVAVIGAGMAGRAHAAGYRAAGTVFGPDLPPVRLVAVVDTNKELAEDVRRRYGYQRTEADWRAVAAAEDVDAVSVVVANHLHREMAEGLLAAGKHVLCEKPLAPSVADAEAMTEAAERAGLVASVGYSYRRSPAISAIRDELRGGKLGAAIHFNGRFWSDYGLDPRAPFTWRDQGGPGTGALGDLGSHLTDLAEYVCGPVREISGAVHATAVRQRPIPATAPVGHDHVALTDEFGQVENEDVATFTATFAGGALGTFSVSRVAHGLPAGLGFELFCTRGSAAFDFLRSNEFTLSGAEGTGQRRVIVGTAHPYIKGGLPMDADGHGHGASDLFVYQARAFLDEIVGADALPRCASFRDGLRGLRLAEAITTSARTGAPVRIE
jgi:predicted dehydrogenase